MLRRGLGVAPLIVPSRLLSAAHVHCNRNGLILRRAAARAATGIPGELPASAAACFRRLHALEPDLAPVRIDRARTESVVLRRADDAVQDDAVVRGLSHPA